ncbi:hypothetical protein BaRGS_00005745 [Batillaria attramentaria]|uniref:C-type lectin domain-containing protein n=1 Tax=Batillaria attramentaria TaxID=370345 RepID=A0ABD0LU25_9CAEN
MLIIKGSDCYFAEFTDDMENELHSGVNRRHTEDALIAVIEHGHGSVPHGHDLTVLPSNLTYVRNKYRDLLADFHCLEKDVCTLEKIPGREYLWLGLTDLAHEGKWVWISNGQAPDYNNWYRDAPNNHQAHEGGEDCAFLRVPDHGPWGDYHCELYEERGYRIVAACEAE